MVTVSIPPQKYIVERIAGDVFDVNVMVGPVAVQFAGWDAEAFLEAWRSYLEQRDRPLNTFTTLPCDGESRKPPAGLTHYSLTE